MLLPPQNVPYTVTLATRYGQMLVNRYDTNQANALFKTAEAFDRAEVQLFIDLAARLPEGTTFLDIGANFGVFSLAVAQVLAQRGGKVHAFEAQRVIAYMLCGTTALNSLENLYVHHLAVGDTAGGKIDIPSFDYRKVSSFGSIEFGGTQNEYIGQPPQAPSGDQVALCRIDDFGFENVGLVKIDVEGMEAAVLRGAATLLARDHPWVLVEWLKSERAGLAGFFENLQYRVYRLGGNLLCVPPNTPITIQNDMPDWRS
jgi:FkbM family methyltransferase